MLDMKDRYDQTPGLQIQAANASERLHELYERVDEQTNARNLALAQLADLQGHFDGSEKDRAARGEVIETQGRKISELQAEVHQRLEALTTLYQLNEGARGLLGDLQGSFEAADKDRAASGEVVEAQGKPINELHAQVHLRLEALDALYLRLDENARALVDALHILTDREQRFAERQQYFTEREQHFQEEIARRDGNMAALERRWWWRLGKLIKAL
jgi:chromosome segregation ATPase